MSDLDGLRYALGRLSDEAVEALARGRSIQLSPQKPIGYRQVEMTKAEYGKIHSDQRGTRPSLCGEFRFKICPNPKHEGPRYMAGWCAPFLTDSKAHPLPDSLKAEAQP